MIEAPEILAEIYEWRFFTVQFEREPRNPKNQPFCFRASGFPMGQQGGQITNPLQTRKRQLYFFAFGRDFYRHLYEGQANRRFHSI
jgi:hypothetical protein